MGLDVYLYKKTAPAAEFERRQKAADIIEKKTEALYADQAYNTMTDAEKDAVYKRSEEVAAAEAAILDVPLDKYGSVQMPEECVEINSARYPDHYFKVGYFRSSYNSEGINSVMKRLSLPDLYEVLGYEHGSDYLFTPNWSEVHERALSAARAIRGSEAGDIDIMDISANMFGGDERLPRNEQEALAIVLNELKRSRSFRDDGYSTISGSFYPKGIEVVAMMPGFTDSFTKAMFNKSTPCTYIAFRKKGGNEWYAQAMEIVAETCEYVLAHEDPSAFHLHWSS